MIYFIVNKFTLKKFRLIEGYLPIRISKVLMHDGIIEVVIVYI